MQFPVLIGLYRVFLYILNGEAALEIVSKINKITYAPLLEIKGLETNFFGFDLGTKPSSWREGGVVLLLIPLVTAAFSYWRTKIMQPETQKKEIEKQQKVKKKEKEKQEEDFSSIMQGQMKFMFPLMIGWVSYGFPIGLALYWNTFTAFGILQQLHINKETEN